MRTLVVGYGSIGERHAKVLEELQCEVAVVSSRANVYVKQFSSLQEALANYQPQYVVISNKTNEHLSALKALSQENYRGLVLVEKPLYADLNETPQWSFECLAVGYNLRFHTHLVRLKELIGNEKIVGCHIYCGKYLPDWRPQRDYTKMYSALASEGGGVLRDLSHELDYALWFTGRWTSVAALGGKFSDLDLQSDDSFTLIMQTDRCPSVSIHMDYLQRTLRRDITIQTNRHTYYADLTGGRLSVDGADEVMQEVDRNYTYFQQHKNVMAGGESACSYDEAIEVMKLIEAAELSSKNKQWVQR